ncbi:MAG TPA: NUDIX domain-containing protein [Acidimicrobiia bacterium]|nr:NUDIX domain-containing protein [Acidimicrobiia bacterium]
MESPAAAEVTPRPAATVITLRPTGDTFEVLLVRRPLQARFMGGARVFPGGAVDPADSDPATRQVVRWSGDADEFGWRAAALRELAEEVGIAVTTAGVLALPPRDVYPALIAAGAFLDGDALQYVSNWVTPRGLPIRFDTRFYLLAIDGESRARPDRTEVHDPVWVTPQYALRAAASGEWLVEVPTRVHLEMLATARSVEDALATAAAAIPPRVEPQLRLEPDGAWTVLLPGDPGYAAG